MGLKTVDFLTKEGMGGKLKDEVFRRLGRPVEVEENQEAQGDLHLKRNEKSAGDRGGPRGADRGL